ncbi:MAG: hypothetical protein HY060_16535, partial [Proteobacteria bacterium]|nr:hypothetical protein [Pseudomonadota bacterium]
MVSLQGRVRFELVLYLGIILSVLLTAALLLVLIARQINTASEATADHLFRQEAARVDAELGLLFSIPLKSAAMLADQPAAGVAIMDDGMTHPAVPIVTAVLRHNPDLFSGYVGRVDGSFLQVIATRGDSRMLKAQQAPDGTATIVRTIAAAATATPSAPAGDLRVERWTFLDADGAVLNRVTQPDPTYDPRQRTWYQESMTRAGVDVGQPYVFNS